MTPTPSNTATATNTPTLEPTAPNTATATTIPTVTASTTNIPPTTTAPSHTPTVTGTPAAIATTEINPEEGGTLTSPDEEVELDFPSGAVDTTITVTYIEQMTPTQNTGSFLFAGTSFRIEATDANGEPVTTFDQPFTITIHYDDEEWEQAGVLENTLNLAYWDGEQWVDLLPCTGCTLNTTDNVLTIVLDHLTEFALLGKTSHLIHLPIVLK